jgi:hypothetical protein
VADENTVSKAEKEKKQKKIVANEDTISLWQKRKKKETQTKSLYGKKEKKGKI